MNPIEEIKNRLDIVEVIGSYIKLQKAGANYRAICPFHSEKKPSFFVSPARQIWHCFGCGKGGDIFKFIMEIEGVEFGDALRILAQKAGVELKEYKPEWKTKRKALYEILELSCKFFQKQLEGEVGKKVKEYLFSRGLNKESLEKWRIGWAPDKISSLSDFLLSRGYKEENIISSGVGARASDGKLVDRFQSRIIFPIFDFNSQVIGFGGRIFGEKAEKEVAKYINTPATLLYDKSKVLYGLDKARVEIRKKDYCIVVEGYIDAILVSQAGFQNVVAVSGTALTDYHLKILGRYTNNLYLSFDMDVGGETATKRGVNLAQSKGFNIKIITLPEGKDPADVISEDPQKWAEYIEKAKDIMDFYFDLAFSRYDKTTPEGKKEISALLLPYIKRIPNKILQAHWVQRLSSELGVEEEDIREELKKTKIEQEFSLPPISSKEIKEEEAKQKSREERLEERVLAILLKEPDLLEKLKEDLRPFFSEKSLRVISLLEKAIKEKKENKKILEMIDEIQEKYGFEDKEFLDYLILKSEVELGEAPDISELEKEIDSCLRELKFCKIKEKMKEISQEIKMAEEKGDLKTAEKLSEEFNKLSRQLPK